MIGLIELRNLPGVGRLEWDLANHGWSDENLERASDLAVSLFGIDADETYPVMDESGGGVIADEVIAEPAEFRRRCEEWERHFDVTRLFRDEADLFWASVGWDVTDGEGKRLRAMDQLERPLVCLVKKIHPDAELDTGEDETAEAWGAAIEAEARRYKRQE